MYPIEKYDVKQYTQKNNGGSESKVIIALSTYAGKAVKGVAKCQPGDDYNFEIGKELAAARCDLKVCEKRKNRAEKKLRAAIDELEKLQKYVNRMHTYHNDAMEELYESYTRLCNIESKLK